MRAAPAILAGLLAGLVLLAAPVGAQDKTKSKEPATPLAVELLDLCELYAKGDVLANSTAVGDGWDAGDATTDNVFVTSYDGIKTVDGVGDIELFVLIETYPQLRLGYCRIDIGDPQSDVGVAELDALERLSGNLEENTDGIYGAWNGTGLGADYMLLANQDEFSFGLQLTILERAEAE